MKYLNALKVLERNAVLMVEETRPGNVYNRRFSGIANGYRVMITTQGEDVSTMRVAGVKEQDDPQSDYFAGSYLDSMPQILRAMGLTT